MADVSPTFAGVLVSSSSYSIAVSLARLANAQDEMPSKLVLLFSAWSTDEGVINAGFMTFFVDISSVIYLI